VAVPYARARNRCAVRALQAWLQAAAIHRGPVFRQMRSGDTLTDRRLSDQSVALIVNAAPKPRARRGSGVGAASLASSPGKTRRGPHVGDGASTESPW